MNSTTYAKMTEHKPVDILFRGVLDIKSKTKKVAFVDAFQILNDRYLGRMNVCNYFAVAENSVRVNELNIIALEELKNYHLVMKENYNIPENLVYSIPVTTRFLDNEQDFEILLSTLKKNGYKKGSIILAFYGVTLERLNDAARKRYTRLRRAGYKTAVAQFGEDFNSIDVFAGFTFDYLRCEARYFDATPNKKKLLAMLVRFCNANKIGLVMEGVDTSGQLARFKRAGVKFATGRALSELSRWVTNEFLYLPSPQAEKKDAYIAKLKKELDAKQRAEASELAELRKAAEEKVKSGKGEGVMPSAPRPELAKSPYWIRLEQQRNTARKSAEARIAAQLIVQNENEEKNRIISDMAAMRYQGDVQSALALTFAYENKAQYVSETNLADEVRKDEEGRAFVTGEESGVSAPVRPEFREEAPKKKVEADMEAHDRLLEEYRADGMFGGLKSSDGLGGIGVKIRIEKEDKSTPPIVGSYNEKCQWVDEDGNVFDGYFDANGKWIEYEKFEVATEGSYNEYAQWVDKDGVVYDGYFDESGRWIDYAYTDENGEIVDNGYFDDKIKKWVPFGYFDEDGGYHRF